MSGQFRSPFIRRKVLRGRELKICNTSNMYDSGLDGGMYRQHKWALSGCVISIISISILGWVEIRWEEMRSEVAIRIPPPLDGLSLR
jgi:hypothetical protein